MAKSKETVTFFHLYRGDGSALFLHGFSSPQKLIEGISGHEIKGKYGREPRVESMTLFRNDLYRSIDEGVNAWIADMRFIPRFLISASVFLLTYFFMSFIIRDPLPMLDELAISLGLSVGTYFLMTRKDRKSNAAMKKRLELREKVDNIRFEADPFVLRAEEALHKAEKRTPQELVEDILSGEVETLGSKDSRTARELIAYLEEHLNAKESKKQRRLLSKINRGVIKGGSQEVTNRLESRKVDIPLLSLYRKIKTGVQEDPK